MHARASVAARAATPTAYNDAPLLLTCTLPHTCVPARVQADRLAEILEAVDTDEAGDAVRYTRCFCVRVLGCENPFESKKLTNLALKYMLATDIHTDVDTPHACLPPCLPLCMHMRCGGCPPQPVC